MKDLCRLIGWTVVDLFRSRATLEAEIWTLRQQINVLRRMAPTKHAFSAIDRLIFVSLYWLFPKIRDALAIVKPDTIVRWHRAGFKSYWRWKSGPRGGRPTVPLEIRKLIREMSIANPLWGAPPAVDLLARGSAKRCFSEVQQNRPVVLSPMTAYRWNRSRLGKFSGIG